MRRDVPTYIIDHYSPLMLCALILYVSGGTYSLTSTPNDRFLRYFRSFFRKSAEGKSPKKYYCFHIWFWCLTWDMNRGFTSNKWTHYVLDYRATQFMHCKKILLLLEKQYWITNNPNFWIPRDWKQLDLSYGLLWHILKSAEWKSPKKYFFFIFPFDAW